MESPLKLHVAAVRDAPGVNPSSAPSDGRVEVKDATIDVDNDDHNNRISRIHGNHAFLWASRGA